MSMSINEVINVIRALTPEEQTQVRKWLNAPPLTPEEKLARALYEAGLLREIKPTRRARPRRPPVPVQGKPLSETIIEERDREL